MKKMVLIFILIGIFLLPINVSAQDIEINVDYNNVSGFHHAINVSEIFDEKGIAPGDIFNYNIKINNTSIIPVNLYLNKVEPINKTDLSMFLFSFYDQSGLLLQDKALGFNESLISTIDANSSKVYTLQVRLDEKTGNEYQNSMFKMDIRFGVKPSNEEDVFKELPYTGESRIPYYILGSTIGLTLTVLFWIIIGKRKKDKEDVNE